MSEPCLETVLADVKLALAEDLGSGDVSAALIPVQQQCMAEIISREAMTLCGTAWVDLSFKSLSPTLSIEWFARDGQKLSEPSCLCRIQGSTRAILSAERTALNFLQTLSATATATASYVEQLKESKTRLLDTRKTLPGLRYAQKYAVRCGGGLNHRFGLYDAYLIKENRILACGSITQAIQRARDLNPHLLLEVEVETIAELKEALEAGCKRVMLDNFTSAMIEEAVALNYPKRCELEVSGGVSQENIASLARTGIDYISVGAITKSVQAIDLSLLIRE